jgi:two-component system, NtrC family, response regulator AtoC
MPTIPRCRVLVAEDDPVLRRLVADALRADGFEVREAGDGCELVAAVEAVLATGGARDAGVVVVSDVHMPGLDGLDVLTILRCADVPCRVVLMTAFGDEETAAEARELGGTLLAKPFDMATLRAAVRAAAAA